MSFQTSFYIHIDNYVKLSNAATRTGATMQVLIIQMMYKYAMDYTKMQIEQRTVQYQPMIIKGSGKIFRIALPEKDYELFTDMRKVMKKSVSYLIALAIEKYLDIIVSKILKQLFNYTYLIHDSAGEKVENLTKWHLIWNLNKSTSKQPPRKQ